MESKGIFQDIFAKMRLSGVCKTGKNKISGFLTGQFSSAERDLHDTIPYMQESRNSSNRENTPDRFGKAADVWNTAINKSRMTVKKLTQDGYRGKRVLRNPKRQQMIWLILITSCLAVFLLSSGLFLHAYLSGKDEARSFDRLAELAGRSEGERPAAEQQSPAPASPDAELEDSRSARLNALHDQNADLCGWLSIADTNINYPVMLTPDDPEYYLRRDFEKNDSISGVPFLGAGCDLNSNNMIVYGHNMKNGTMFADLLNFQDEEYLDTHPVISFDTLAGPGEYEIIGAFRDKVHYQNEQNVFRYYEYGGELTEERFGEYIAKIKELSLFDTGITAEYGDQLLTLSTCSYHTKNGRFVVVAKKVIDTKRLPDNLSFKTGVSPD